MFYAELTEIQLGGTAGSGFEFSLFRANEKNKIASGRQGTILDLAREDVTSKSNTGKLIVAASRARGA
jgi:hypothetical protein